MNDTELPFSPAAERNQQPILDALRQVLPERGSALEVASGTGQHAVHLAAGLPHWRWQPTDQDPVMLPVIAARREASGLPNLLAPLRLDVRSRPWPSDGPAFEERFDLVFCANMLHIAPWEVCAALMEGAARHLQAHGVLVTYGPYLEDGVDTSEGNRRFDASLRSTYPEWGLRHLHEVADQAEKAGLALRTRIPMPANNLLLVWGRTG